MICEREEARQERLVHHTDRGVQYVSIRYTERLAEAGVEPSVGSRGDSYDNALAETVIGLFIGSHPPARPLEKAVRRGVRHAGVGLVVHHHRLLESIGYVPPAEYEEAFYRREEAQTLVPALT